MEIAVPVSSTFPAVTADRAIDLAADLTSDRRKAHAHTTSHRGAVPGSPVRLAIAPHNGTVDGAWWPRTRRPTAELRALVAELHSSVGVVNRLSLSVTQWDSSPARVRVFDRDVRLIWFAYRDPHTVIVGHGTDETVLLLIPPETEEPVAKSAMAMAVDPIGSEGALAILG